MIDLSRLHSLIQDELVLGQELLATFKKERALLEKRDLEGLQAVLNSKADMLSRLEAIRTRREDYLKEIAFPVADNALIEHLKASELGSAAKCIETLQSLNSVLLKCNDSNKLNGLIIANSRKRNSDKLDIMRGKAGNQPVYDAKGTTSRSGPSRPPLNEA